MSPIIATILLVAITVVLAAVLYILISGLTKGPGNTPLGTALALGSVNEGAAGTTNWYNVTVQSAGGGMQLNSMNFQIQNPSGGIVTAAAGKVTVLSVTGCQLAVYTFSTNAWANPASGACTGVTLGGPAPAASGQTLSVSTTTALSGDTLIVIGAGSFSGSVSQAIP